MVFCFIIHQGRMNGMGGKGNKGHKDTVNVPLAVSRHGDFNLSVFVQCQTVPSYYSDSIFCAKVVRRTLERPHRAHFEMWFQGWLAFYDCVFMTWM